MCLLYVDTRDVDKYPYNWVYWNIQLLNNKIGTKGVDGYGIFICSAFVHPSAPCGSDKNISCMTKIIKLDTYVPND